MFTDFKMKVVICLLAIVTITFGFPQQHEGFAFSNDAIKQAQSTYLIPRDAQIQSVILLLLYN